MNCRLDNVQFSRLVELAAREPQVREAVLRSFDDNPWWPKAVADWRMRMLIAGLSTRVSFRMLETYKRVIGDFGKKTFEDISLMPDPELASLVKPLGLVDSRISYLRSMISFVSKYGDALLRIPVDTAVETINREVNGAGYKVGACCILYARGYGCGVIPADSGIKDAFGPCIGLYSTSGKYGHELVRFQLEAISPSLDARGISERAGGYESIDLSSPGSRSWWFHLVVINFKRHFCNNHRPDRCPLKMDKELASCLGSMCSRESPQLGGNRIVVVEGCDGVGKTTLCDSFVHYGFKSQHFKFDGVRPVFEKYRDLIEQAKSERKNSRSVWDRSFISEHVYGPVMRGGSRISDDQFVELCARLGESGGAIIYLSASADVLVERIRRRPANPPPLQKEDIERLLARYDEVLLLAANHCRVTRVETDVATPVDVARTAILPAGSAMAAPGGTEGACASRFGVPELDREERP